MPGPALREEGMSSVSGRVLVVRGLRAGTVTDDTLRVPRGEVREVRYRAEGRGLDATIRPGSVSARLAEAALVYDRQSKDRWCCIPTALDARAFQTRVRPCCVAARALRHAHGRHEAPGTRRNAGDTASYG